MSLLGLPEHVRVVNRKGTAVAFTSRLTADPSDEIDASLIIRLDTIARAREFKRLLKRGHLSKQELARRLGLSRSHISNTIRLLRLPNAIKLLISNNELTAQHGRALLRLPTSDLQIEVATRMVSRRLSSRESDLLVRETLARISDWYVPSGADQ